MVLSKVESILFVAGKEMAIKEIAKLCNSSKDEVEVVLENLKEKYNKEESGINLLVQENKVEMVSNPKNKEVVAQFIKEEVKSELTRPQLETLTIAAYRAPITKLELEQIRGVSCTLILRNLIIKDLIEVIEDKNPDNNKYTISMEFMKHLGINNVEELPNYDKLAKIEEIEDVINQD